MSNLSPLPADGVGAAAAKLTGTPNTPKVSVVSSASPVRNLTLSPLLTDDPNQVSVSLQDALGVTPQGTCLRHPNCPVLDSQRIMSCRVCFSEEKSVGMTQRKSFKAVVQQLQRMNQADRDLLQNATPPAIAATSTDVGASSAVESSDVPPHTPSATITTSTAATADTSSNLALEQPQTLESIMKRLAQVQNWTLRQKEKEVMSLQQTIHKLEERLQESQTTVDAQKATIKGLRKTIQQDLKIIKTMATQKEKELEAQQSRASSTTASSTLSSSNHSKNNTTDAKKAPRAPANVNALLGHDQEAEQDDEVSESELYSPVRTDRNRSSLTSPPDVFGSPTNAAAAANAAVATSASAARPYSSPPKSNTNAMSQRPGLGAAAAAMSGADASSLLERRRGRKNLLERTPSTLSLDASVTIPEEIGGGDQDDEEVDEAFLAKLQAHVIVYGDGQDDGSSDNDSSNNNEDDENENEDNKDDDQEDDDDDDSSADSQENSIFAPPKRSEYWTDADMSMASDPSKIFASFRGGLLDIPKSPPPNRHDKRAPKKKLQIHIDSRERGVLRIPSMRSVVRSNSGMSDATGASMQSGIPLGLMSSALQAAPFDGESDYSAQSPASPGGGGGENRQRHKPIVSGPPAVLHVPMFGGLDDDSPATLNSPGISGTGAGGALSPPYSVESLEAYKLETEVSPIVDTKPSAAAATASKTKLGERELYSITRETCQDKYGDPGIYTGTVLAAEGLPHGKGIMNYESGRVYDGEWLAGHWNGHGKLLNPNGDKYDGGFVFDARHGHGVYKWDNGDVYVGHFSQDKRHGKGKFSFHNGNVYEGEFVDGMFEGYGKYTFADGFYEGNWKQGRYDGSGELRYAKGGKYTGEFRNSVAHGFGLEVSPGGKTRRGVWQEGKPVNF